MKKIISGALILSILLTLLYVLCGCKSKTEVFTASNIFDGNSSIQQKTENYNNNGIEIKVIKDCKINIEELQYAEKEGYLFIGWRNKETEEYPVTDSFSKGSVLEATYISYNEDFILKNTQVTNDYRLAFDFSQNNQFCEQLPEILESGALMMLTDDGGYYDMFLDEPVIISWKWNSDTGLDFEPDIKGKVPTSYKFDKAISDNDNHTVYRIQTEPLQVMNYTDFYSAKGYIKFKDFNNTERILYTEQVVSSLYKCAVDGEQNNDVVKTVVIKTKEIFEEKKQSYKYERALSYGSGADGDVYNIFSYDKLYVRDLVIETGIEGFEETDICFLTDPHFNYINKDDVNNGLETTLSSYRGRSFAREGFTITAAITAMKFAQRFDKIVMGGDALDYVSHGALSITSRIFTERAINGNIMMVLGNHEGDELCQPDKNLQNILSLEERFDFCQKKWTNDVYYTKDILKSSSGKEQVMLIGLNNSRGNYFENQITPLENDLQYAREKSIPVLIFQHVPMLTMNEKEKQYSYARSEHTYFFANDEIESQKANTTVDMTSNSGYLGHALSDEATMTVCKLIRTNSDIIKGVFHGHEPGNMYTEIVGLGSDGKPNGITIPQHGVSGTHYYAAMSITLK